MCAINLFSEENSDLCLARLGPGHNCAIEFFFLRDSGGTAYMTTPFRVVACIVAVCIVVACVAMAYIVMAYIVMAYAAMTIEIGPV